MRKRRNPQQRKRWVTEIFLQRESHGAANTISKDLLLKDTEPFFRQSLLWYLVLQFCATFTLKNVLKKFF